MKQIIKFFFVIIANIPRFFFIINSIFCGKKRSFISISQVLSLVPGIFGILLRSAFYHLVLERCSQECCIEFLTTFVDPRTWIGQNVYIGAQCNISMAHIGDDCLFGSGIMVTSGQNQHAFTSRDIPIRLQGGSMQLITIGRDCWIGNGAIIMADVGDGCVVAAGSVVTKPVPPFSIAAGVPAKVVGTR